MGWNLHEAMAMIPAGDAEPNTVVQVMQKGYLLNERLIGDGLVPLDSALGRQSDPARTLALPKQRQWIGFGMGHLDLLNRPEVYAQLSRWLGSRA